MLFAINSFLQGLKRPIWTLWISIYRQGIGIALFVWLYIGVFEFDVWGVWFGIATAVSSGWVVALFVARKVGREELSGTKGKTAASTA